jgi:membrane-associated phospholipid phosphatase
VAAIAIMISVAAPARGEETRRLRYDTAIDGTITAAGGILWITSELLKPSLAPQSCRWCDEPLNPIDAAVKEAARADRRAAHRASNVLGFVGVPVLLYAADALVARRDGRLSEWSADALVITEAAVLAADVNQAVKVAVGRERPFVHTLPADRKSGTHEPEDNHLSFYSGHTTLAFALATATGTVATMRGYSQAPAIWGVGMPLAALTGYLRIAADRHYFTDVLAGAVVGAAIGAVVPLLHGTEPRGAGVGTSALRVAVAF